MFNNNKLARFIPAGSNPSAKSNDSKTVFAFDDTKNWVISPGLGEIPIVAGPLDAGNDGVDDQGNNHITVTHPIFKTNSDNRIFTDVDRVARYERCRFLNNITLANLAIDFNTNSRYLSKIINVNKGKNFSTYISDLRIDYSIEKLKTNEKFRKLAIKGIAFEIGFNNTESFSKAFYRKTGIYPSYFIKEIEKQQF